MRWSEFRSTYQMMQGWQQRIPFRGLEEWYWTAQDWLRQGPAMLRTRCIRRPGVWLGRYMLHRQVIFRGAIRSNQLDVRVVS
jgi:hypothetical protein